MNMYTLLNNPHLNWQIFLGKISDLKKEDYLLFLPNHYLESKKFKKLNL